MRYLYTHTLPILLAALGLAVAPRLGLAKPEPPKLEVSPSQVRLRLGEGKQLQAKLKGREGTVRWTIDGAGAGSVSSTGFFQAPTYGATPATIRVTASVEGDPELKAETVVFLESVSLDVEPQQVQLLTAQTRQFKAKLDNVGDQRVTWSVDGGATHGRISESGLFTAPSSFPTPGTITVRATSVADPSKSGTATVRVGEVRIQIEPKEIVLKHGQSRRFEAKVTGSPNTAVEWSVLGEDMGEVSDSGLYATPAVMATPAVVTVVAKAVADPTKTVVARIRVEPIIVSNGERRNEGGKPKPSALARVARRAFRAAAPSVVRIFLPFDPIDLFVKGPNFQGKSGKRYVPLGGAAALEASVLNTSNDRLVWKLEGQPVGEITEDGIYYAPETLTTPFMAQIRATSVADPSKSALYTLHIPPVVVQTDQKEASCQLGAAVQLKAKVENTENSQIVWTVEGGEKHGLVTETGLYHPPASIATPTVVRVRAASAADPTKSAVIQIKIPEVDLEVSPGSAEVKPGQSVRLKTKVKGRVGSDEVIWQLMPDVGSISPDGIYQAPDSGGPQIVQVNAILKSDPTKVATVTLKLKGR